MSKLTWDATGTRFYETGVDHGVLYTKTLTGSAVTDLNGGYAAGVAWNGLTAVNESPSGAEATALYADNIKYLNLISNEEFGCTIECYTYPEEFAICDGSAIVKSGSTDTGLRLGQQTRKEFGFCYRTKIGDDIDGTDKGYKLHIVYGALASPSSKDYSSINDSPEAITFSYEVTTTPISAGSDYKPVSTLVIDSTKADATCLSNLEDALYGLDADEFSTSKTYAVGDKVKKTVSSAVTYYVCTTAVTTAGEWNDSNWTAIDAGPRLPMPAEVMTIMTPAS